MGRIMLLEDDQSLIDGLVYSLKKEKFEVQVVSTVADAKDCIEQQEQLDNQMRGQDGTMTKGRIDLMLLDVTLPDGTGFEVCEYARAKGSAVPIMFLTVADEEYNVIRGLDCGGDDYITKPFKLGELTSRIKALLRRAAMRPTGTSAQTIEVKTDDNKLVSGPVTIDLLASRVMLDGKTLELTAVEYRLLCILLRNKNQIVTRQIIFDSMWDGNGDFVDDNTLSVYIRRLREKIEADPSHPSYLKTARRFGYIWEEA